MPGPIWENLLPLAWLTILTQMTAIAIRSYWRITEMTGYRHGKLKLWLVWARNELFFWPLSCLEKGILPENSKPVIPWVTTPACWDCSGIPGEALSSPYPLEINMESFPASEATELLRPLVQPVKYCVHPVSAETHLDSNNEGWPGGWEAQCLNFLWATRQLSASWFKSGILAWCSGARL